MLLWMYFFTSFRKVIHLVFALLARVQKPPSLMVVVTCILQVLVEFSRLTRFCWCWHFYYGSSTCFLSIEIFLTRTKFSLANWLCAISVILNTLGAFFPSIFRYIRSYKIWHALFGLVSMASHEPNIVSHRNGLEYWKIQTRYGHPK